jgi:hypothetical protein
MAKMLLDNIKLFENSGENQRPRENKLRENGQYQSKDKTG